MDQIQKKIKTKKTIFGKYFFLQKPSYHTQQHMGV